MLLSVLLFPLATGTEPLLAQAYKPPNRGHLGDEIIQNYLSHEAEKLRSQFFDNIESTDEWTTLLPSLKEEYFYLLGLWPLPSRTPLAATITDQLKRDGFIIEMLHSQSQQRL